MIQHARLADLSLTFSETAFLLWETHSRNYAFADWFNRLYGLELARQNDLLLSDGSLCPFFVHYDENAALLYILIDNPHSGLLADFANYDKIMLINGRDAFEQQQTIYNDYATHLFPPAADDLLQWRHYEQLLAARQEVYSVHYFDYSQSAEAQQNAMDEIRLVRRGDSHTAPIRRTTPIPTPQSSLLTAVRNTRSAKVRNTLNHIYLLFEDILHALENPIYNTPNIEEN